MLKGTRAAQGKGGLSWLVVMLTALVGCTDADSEDDPGSGGGGQGGTTTVTPPPAGLGDCPCEPGELDNGDGTCTPAGVTECATGFSLVDGGCEAILPATACTTGQMALPGETTCREVAPCGSGTWGDIPTDGSTEHVDGSYQGTSNGTASQPWKTIQQGVNAAGNGDLVAVAAGTYAENVMITKPLRLWGKCPAEVAINGPGAQQMALLIQDTSAVEIHDLAITGSGVGVAVNSSTGVVVDRVWIHNTTSMGVNVATNPTSASATIARSLIENVALFGVYGIGATAVVEATEIRGTVVGPNGDYGRGITVLDSPDGSHRATLTVEGSYVHHSVDYGIRAAGADVVLRDTLVTDTAPGAGPNTSGNGVKLRATAATGQRSVGLIERVVVRRSNECGICVDESDAELVNTTVSDVTALGASVGGSQGVFVSGTGAVSGAPPVLSLRSSLIHDIMGTGVRAWKGETTLRGVWVRDTQWSSEESEGRGLHVHEDWDTGESAPLLVEGSRFERTVDVGILVQSTDATIRGTLVSEVSRLPDGTLGRGIAVDNQGDFASVHTTDVSCSCIEHVHEAGLSAIGAAVTVESTLVRHVAPSTSTLSMRDNAAGILGQRGFKPDDWTSLSVSRSEIHDIEQAAIVVIGIEASLAQTWVHDTSATVDDRYGDGIAVLPWPLDPGPTPAQLTIDQCIVENSARAGLASWRGGVSVGNSLLLCNTMSMVADPAGLLAASITDMGGVDCACGTEVDVCKVLSTSIEPPSPLLEQGGQTGAN
ncbi:MAG: right-handed parallel beta-helix repeat-containing protein [Deltaproteobacteria bacterium]|nr:right-handed parallel beta-helix repeat-containing protein [Deltaproteobacteria bacterium]